MRIKRIVKTAGFLVNQLTSITGCSANKGNILKVKKGDVIIITIKIADKE